MAGLDFIDLSRSRNKAATATAVVRTKRLGRYRPELPHSGDMEMWLRLAADASVGVFEGYHAVYRRQRANMSNAYQVKAWVPDLQQVGASGQTDTANVLGRVYGVSRPLETGWNDPVPYVAWYECVLHLLRNRSNCCSRNTNGAERNA